MCLMECSGSLQPRKGRPVRAPAEEGYQIVLTPIPPNRLEIE